MILEPFLLLRLAAGLVATALFAYAAVVSRRILLHASLSGATEGQLALERQAELAGTFARVAAVVQTATLVMSVLTADRLSKAIRGAMCGYGVVTENAWGAWSLGATAVVAVASAVLTQLFALDRRVRGLDLLRPLALGGVLMAPLAALDLVLASAWLGKLDLSVVASCCSTTLDAGADARAAFATGPRALATWGAVGLVALAIVTAVFAARAPARPRITLAGAATLAALPVALGAAVLEVAPHVYEVPYHLCPFCLFKADAHFIGYPLFGAMFFAVVWLAAAVVGSALSGTPTVRAAFEPFARSRLTRGAAAWGTALIFGAAPVVAYAVSSGGASLFR